MLRVALVDDEPLGRERIRALLADEQGVTLIGEYSTGEEALTGILESAPQVLFLDVQMPGVDGFGLVQLLESHLPPDQRPFIVVVTAYDEYALRAFDVSAVDYLLKPFDRARFRAALARARTRVTERPRPEARFVVRSASKMTLVRAADVQWIAGEGNYARLHSSGRRHLVRETLKSVEARLDPSKFVRVHRSAIVNVDCVATLEPHVHGQYVLTMKDGSRITSSRTHSAKLRALLKSR
ncbi:MAG TPA: LytTR family DNA-binding domain-containing protein [Gemmatimonadaceae bacterium]|nr:LytTR family DNA-binding domain-containing protein [Gemmatimonadaceae bacterium]